MQQGDTVRCVRSEAAPYLRLARQLAGCKTVRAARAVVDAYDTAADVISRHDGAPAQRRAKTKPHATVGIWQRLPGDGESVFVRQPDVDDPVMWADVERILDKQHRTRIVLLGESAARGYPMDPLCSCASALAHYLVRAAPDVDTEVVDLARNGLTFPGLLSLLRAARALAPDAYVIFAGNNWTMDAAHLNWGEIADVISQSGRWSSLQDRCDAVFRAQVETWMDLLAAEARRQDVPAVFIIPARNTTDHRVHPAWRNPLLSSEQDVRRDDLLGSATELTAAGGPAEAAALLSRLLDADDESGPAELELYAMCLDATGRAAQAHAVIEKASRYWLRLPMRGEIASYVARVEVMRAVAATKGLPVVDLPALFAEEQSALGRDLFFDSVHMTPRAINIAMAAAARQTVLSLDLSCEDAGDVERESPSMDPSGAAQAHLMAALWSVGAFQPDDLIAHHLKCAVERSPEITVIMRQYLEVLLRRGPAFLCRSFQDLLLLGPRAPVVRYLLSREMGRESVSLRLVQLLSDTLAESMPSVTDDIERLIGDGHSVSNNTVDLLNHIEPHPQLSGNSARGPVYLRSFVRQLRMWFACGLPLEPVTIRLTSRVRGPVTRTCKARVILNGRVSHEWSTDSVWTTTEFTVPADVLCRGVNRLQIMWPPHGQSRRTRIACVTRTLREMPLSGHGFASELYPVYGEIYSCTAALAGRKDSRP